MTWKSYALVSGAGIVATYLASPPLLPQRSETPAAARDAAATAAIAADIEEEAARLHARLRAEAAFRAPARDPFRFGQPAPRPSRSGTEALSAPEAVAPPAPQPEPPFIVLAGVATDTVDGAPQRTAILTTTSGVLLVRAGELVGAEYRVRAIGSDRVELESTADGTIRELRLAVPIPGVVVPDPLIPNP